MPSSTSIVWNFFCICDDDESKAKCLVNSCNKIFNRGNKAGGYGTKNLLTHLDKALNGKERRSTMKSIASPIKMFVFDF